MEKNKYMVKIVNLFSSVVEVEAIDEEGARDEAHKVLQSGSSDLGKAFYESTLPRENWAVITKEKYEEIKQQVESDLKNSKDIEGENKIITP